MLLIEVSAIIIKKTLLLTCLAKMARANPTWRLKYPYSYPAFQSGKSHLCVSNEGSSLEDCQVRAVSFSAVY